MRARALVPIDRQERKDAAGEGQAVSYGGTLVTAAYELCQHISYANILVMPTY